MIIIMLQGLRRKVTDISFSSSSFIVSSFTFSDFLQEGHGARALLVVGRPDQGGAVQQLIAQLDDDLVTEQGDHGRAVVRSYGARDLDRLDHLEGAFAALEAEHVTRGKVADLAGAFASPPILVGRVKHRQFVAGSKEKES